MKRVVIESPYAGRADGWIWPISIVVKWLDRLDNIRYLRACMADSIARGEAPYASHGLYTQPGVLNDEIPEDRAKGIEAGFAWGDVGELRAFYIDKGVSGGMKLGDGRAKRIGQATEIRVVPGWNRRRKLPTLP